MPKMNGHFTYEKDLKMMLMTFNLSSQNDKKYDFPIER